MTNFEIIQKAIDAKLVVKAIYNGKKREMEPVELLKGDESVRSFERNIGEPRTMTIEALENLEITNESFVIRSCMVRKSKAAA